jgi:hypothetical protein
MRRQSGSGWPRIGCGAGQAETLAKRAFRVAGAERAAVAQFRDERPGDLLKVVRQRAGTEPETVEPRRLFPVEQQVRQFAGRAGDDRAVRSEVGAVEVVEPPLARRGGAGGLVDEHYEVRVDLERRQGTFLIILGGADLRHDLRGVLRAGGGHEDDVGRAGGEAVGHVGVRERGDDGLALRRAGRDGRAADGEPAAVEVDVVQLAAVDEPAGRHVADHRVVLPGVPQPPHDLDGVGGLVEQVAEVRGDGGVGDVLLSQRRELAAAEVPCLVRRRRDPRAPAGPALAHVVQGRDGRGEVERLRVRGDRRGNQADARGVRGDPRCGQHRVQPAAHLVGAVVRACEAARGLQAERVFDGQEVEGAGFGLAGQVRPVPGAEQLPGPRVRRAPGGGVPAGPVERHREVQFAGFRHDRLLPAVREPVTDANRPPAKPSNPIVYIAC